MDFIDRDNLMEHLNNRILIYDDDMYKIKYDIDVIGKKVTYDNKKYKITSIINEYNQIIIRFSTCTRQYIIEITKIPKVYEKFNLDKIRAYVRTYKKKIFTKNQIIAVDTHHIGTHVNIPKKINTNVSSENFVDAKE